MTSIDEKKIIKALWNYLGERGVYSCDSETLKECFDIFRYEGDIFCYRLKSTIDIKKIKPKNLVDGWFKDVTFHDPMQNLIMREEGDRVNFLTIDHDDDVIETEFCLTYSKYKELEDNPLILIYKLHYVGD